MVCDLVKYRDNFTFVLLVALSLREMNTMYKYIVSRNLTMHDLLAYFSSSSELGYGPYILLVKETTHLSYFETSPSYYLVYVYIFIYCSIFISLTIKYLTCIKVKVKSLCLTNHHAMMMYREVEVWLHAFFDLATRR